MRWLLPLFLLFSLLRAEAGLIELTAEEQRFIQQNPVITMGYSSQIEPLLIKKNGKFSGILPEYYQLLTEMTGIKFQIVDDTWRNTLRHASLKKLDGVLLLNKSAAQPLGLLMSKSPFDFLITAYAKTKRDFTITDEKDLDGLRVAYFKNAKFLDHYFSQRSGEMTLVKSDSPFDALKKVVEGKADVMIGSNFNHYLLSKHSIFNIEPVYVFDGDLKTTSGIGVQADKPELISILNKAIDSISLEKRNTIIREWTGSPYRQHELVKLSEKESVFLQQHPKILVHNELNWPPFNFYEFGKPKGYSIDLMNLVAQKTGMHIEYVSGPTWNEFLEMMKEGSLDVMLNIAKTPERGKYLRFTDPFLMTMHGIAIHRENDSVHSFSDLIEKKKSIALERGFFYHEYIQKHYPEANLMLLDDSLQTLQAVAYKQADATLGIMPVMHYISDKNYINNLKYFGDAQAALFEPIHLHMAARKDAPELVSILQKGLGAISEKERKRLATTWLEEDQDKIHQPVKLTAEERKWLQEHPSIRLTADPKYLPYEAFDDNGKHMGMVADYLELIEKRLDIRFEKIPTESWTESLELAKSGKVDVLSNYTVDEALKDIHLSTESYIQSPIVIVTRKESGLNVVNDMKQLKNKKIAVIKGYGYLNEIFDAYPHLNYIEVENAVEGLKGVSETRYDALVCSLTLAVYKIGELGLQNLKIAGQTGSDMQLGLGIRKDWSVFIDIFNKALRSITPGERREIREKWLGDAEVVMGMQRVQLDFSEKEKAWLDQNIPIKYAYDPDWAPFEWKNDLGKHTGIVNDLLKIVADRTGVKFEAVGVETWAEAVKLAEHGEVDMYSGVGENQERQAYMNFTSNVLYKAPYVFVVRQDHHHDHDRMDAFKTLNHGEKVAVVDGYTIHGLLKEEQPALKLTTVASTMEGFKKLTNGEIDIFIVNKATAKYYMNRKGFHQLKIATTTHYNLELKSAIRKDWPPEVISIIDKAIQSISEKDLDDIYAKWTEIVVIDESSLEKYATELKMAAGAVLLMIFLSYYWNRQLNQKVRVKTSELNLLLESFDQHVIASKTDIKGTITYVSDAFCEISGYSREELISYTHRKLKHQDMDAAVYQALWKTIKNGQTWKGEIKNRKKNGESYWVEVIIEPDYDLQHNHIGYKAIRQDITAKKVVEELSRTLEQKVEERTSELADANEELQATQSAIEDQRSYLEKVLDAQNSIVITTDGQKIRSANKAFLKFFYLDTLADFLENYDCICDTFEMTENQEYLQKFMGDSTWVEYVMAHPDKTHRACIDGSVFNVEASPFRSGGELFHLAVLTDITPLEKAQDHIRRNEERFRFSLQSMGAHYWIDDLVDKSVVYSSAQFFYECGYEDDEIPHDFDAYVALIHPDDLPMVIEKFQKYCNGEIDKYEMEFRFRQKDGSWKWTYNPGYIIEHDKNHKVTKVAGLTIDITERKVIEERLKEFHRKTSDSINYASLIQTALLPEVQQMEKYFDDCFTIWQPKDVVGGDIYLYEALRHEDEALLMVIDCTGHGVPGAFMTMLVKAVERNIVSELLTSEEDVHPAKILQVFNRTIRMLLKQDNPDASSNAGFDGGILYFDKSRNLIRFAGAETPLFHFEKEGELKITKGDRQGIGYKTSDPGFVFTEHEFKMDTLDRVLMTTDGYIDQNGGEKGFPFGKKRLKKILEENRQHSCEKLEDALLRELKTWQQEEERNDDVTVVGVRILSIDSAPAEKPENWMI